MCLRSLNESLDQWTSSMEVQETSTPRFLKIEKAAIDKEHAARKETCNVAANFQGMRRPAVECSGDTAHHASFMRPHHWLKN
ncbi:hypothetical protein OPV22_023961 [Ensete ventricosum]|uniref:Uncharacterized protein n=1 Tax=Ensete ventricosum TaxID=4639 RepID=A0AAV8QXX0_ENSVE|nr:hypothetical protein OPV22_023961 [Ensete ventricosum]